MSKSEQSQKVVFGCMVAFILLIGVAWLQKIGVLPKY
jgi:hypothetical protein